MTIGLKAGVIGLLLFGQYCCAMPPMELRTNSFSFGNLAHEFRIRSWAVEDGLPQNTVNCLLQTADGYLWIGTRNGLARYDGRKFRVFDSRNTPGFLHNDILSLCESPPGTLWIGTKQGLVRLRDHQFTGFDVGQQVGSANATAIWSICARRAGGLWLATSYMPMHFVDGTAVGYPNYPGYQNPWPPYQGANIRQVLQVMEDAQGILWLRDGRGILRLPPGATEFELIYAPRDNEGLFLASAGLLENPSGEVMCGWMHGLLSCAPTRVTGFTYRENGFWGPAAPVAWDERSRLWLKSDAGGLSLLQGDHFTHFKPPMGLSDDRVETLIVGREGNFWLGTALGGLNQLRPRRVLNLTTADGLAGDSVWSISEAPDGSVWIATEGGLSQYQGGQFTTHQATSSDPFYRNEYSKVHVVLARKNGEIVTSSRAGLLQAVAGRLEPSPLRENRCLNDLMSGFLNFWVDTLYEDSSGALWVGTGHELLRFQGDACDRVLPTWTQETNGIPVLTHSSITGILEDVSGAIWVGTKRGLTRLKDGQWDRFTAAEGLPADYVGPALADPDGSVWIASDRGLIRYRDGQFFLFTTAHGLFENLVLSVLEDEFGWLWLNGHRGLQRVRKQELHDVAAGKRARVDCLHYGEADGMLSAEGNGGALPNSCRTRDGRLWFPTTGGVVVIDPRTLRHNDVPPPVVIEQVIADGDILFGDDMLPGKPPAGASRPGGGGVHSGLSLSPGRARTLVIHYTANSFVSPEKVRFEYWLEGLDAGWQRDDQNLRTAIYTNLRPGKYRFRLKAYNNHGVPSEREAEFAFSLAPYFHQTWPFYILCGATLISVAGGLHHARMTGLRRIKELESLHALEAERSRIARDMHDSLGADLTKIAMLTEMAKTTKQPGSFERVSSLARGLVDDIGELVWATNPRYNTLDSLMSYLHEYAGDLTESAGIALSFAVPEELPSVALGSEARRHLFLAAKEAVNNAVKHARARSLFLAFEASSGQLRITIRDDGSGFDASPPHGSDPSGSGGNGMRNIRERLAELGGSVSIHSESGVGSTIIMDVPLAPES